MRVPDPGTGRPPVKVTEQLPADSVQVLLLNEPVPAVIVNVKVTVPVGMFDGFVVSATVAITGIVQVVALDAMLQLTGFGILVVVVSFATVIVLDPVGPLPR